MSGGILVHSVVAVMGLSPDDPYVCFPFDTAHCFCLNTIDRAIIGSLVQCPSDAQSECLLVHRAFGDVLPEESPGAVWDAPGNVGFGSTNGAYNDPQSADLPAIEAARRARATPGRWRCSQRSRGPGAALTISR